MQFWLDTIGDWERETGRKTLVAIELPEGRAGRDSRRSPTQPLVDVCNSNTGGRRTRERLRRRAARICRRASSSGNGRAGGPMISTLPVWRRNTGKKIRARRSSMISIPAPGPMSAPGDDAESAANDGCPVAGGHSPNATVGGGQWHQPVGFARAGKQYLVYSSGESTAGLDLSAETGSFELRTVNLRTGEVAKQAETVLAGKNVVLPEGVVWVTKQ